MFYCLVDNLPINTDQQPNKRFVRTFIIGCICHIIAYSILSIDLLANNPMIRVFVNLIKKWYWMIFALDLSMLGILHKGFFGLVSIKNLIFGGNKNTAPTNNIGDEQPQQIQPQIRQQIQIHQSELPQPQAQQQPQPQAQQQPQPQRQKSRDAVKKPSEELDIDLLTENEERSNVVEEKHSEHKETSSKVIVPSETQDIPEVDDNDDACDVDEPDTGETDGNPKLTEDNINKYVINKGKIVTNVSLKSEDLNLQ